MSRVFGNIFGSLLLICMLAGCSGNSMLNQKVSELERDVRGLQRLQAEQVNRLEEVGTTLRTLNGKIEELEYTAQQRAVSAVQPRIEQEPPLPPESSGERRPSVISTELPIEALREDEQLVSQAVDPVSEQLLKGLTFLRTQSYAQALATFDTATSMSDKNPTLLPLLSFWKGVTADLLTNHTLALRSYNDLISEYPSHPRTPLALLRLGGVFMELGDEKTAELTYEKLLTDYPKSKEAREARERLR